MDQSAQASENRKAYILLSLFIVFLTGLHTSRVNIGPMPLYFVEGLSGILLVSAFLYFKKRPIPTTSKIILFPAFFFFFFVVLGEMRGAASYSFLLPAIYQIARFGLGIAMLLVLPRLITHRRHLNTCLKAIVVGVLITGTLSVFSSLPPTRPIAKLVFSNPILSPTKGGIMEKYNAMRGEDFGIRGTSLAGPATLTGTYLCTLWPLSLLAYRKLDSFTWKRLALLACILAPFGALVTYSRMSWLGVFLIVGLFGIFGRSGSRRVVILFVSVIMVIVSFVGLNSRFFYMDRIQNRTKATLENPMESGDVMERFLSYTQPFRHLMANPTWLVAGAGSAGGKMAERGSIQSLLYAQGALATHSAIAMAYYQFGLAGALCHVLLMGFGFVLVLRNVLFTRNKDLDEKLTWQVLLAVWLGLLPWWLFGHASVSTARGNMFFFFIFALFLTFEQMRVSRGNGEELEDGMKKEELKSEPKMFEGYRV